MSKDNNNKKFIEKNSQKNYKIINNFINGKAVI